MGAGIGCPPAGTAVATAGAVGTKAGPFACATPGGISIAESLLAPQPAGTGAGAGCGGLADTQVSCPLLEVQLILD